jgi:hypothetical protein
MRESDMSRIIVDGPAVIWDAESGRSLSVWQADLTLVSSDAFSPDGRLIAKTGRKSDPR